MGIRELLAFWRSSGILGRTGLVLALCGTILFTLSLLGAEAEGVVLVGMVAVHLLAMSFLAILFFRMHRSTTVPDSGKTSLQKVPRIVKVLMVLAGVYVIAFFCLAPFVPELTENSSWAVLHGLSAGYTFFGLVGSAMAAVLRS
jgi:hypothetical protein